MPDAWTVNGAEYAVLRLLGKGKGGYSYLVTDGASQYVLKQIHHEPCEYYTFGDKLQSELRDYETLRKLGIPMPRLLADSIAVGVPRNADKALMAIRESNGLVVNVSDAEIMAAQKLLGRTCGVFGEPAGVTGTAGVKKLCEQGVLPKDATVVSVVTGNGLKDVANAIKACGEPISIPSDMDLLLRAFDEHGINADVK